jgi:hypothetical protein
VSFPDFRSSLTGRRVKARDFVVSVCRSSVFCLPVRSGRGFSLARCMVCALSTKLVSPGALSSRVCSQGQQPEDLPTGNRGAACSDFLCLRSVFHSRGCLLLPSAPLACWFSSSVGLGLQVFSSVSVLAPRPVCLEHCQRQSAQEHTEGLDSHSSAPFSIVFVHRCILLSR